MIKSHKWLFLVVLAVVVAGGVYYSRTGLIDKQPFPKPTIKQLPAQPKPNSSQKQPTTSASANQGTAKDNNGQSPTAITTPSNQWVQSQSGAITLQQPVSGAALASGFVLNGTASIKTCQYRLLDDKVGVISQGMISVVDGKFSATVSFKPYGSTGRLDVFSTDSGGREINEVQIPVKF